MRSSTRRSASSRTRWAPCPDRSTASSCIAACARSRCASPRTLQNGRAVSEWLRSAPGVEDVRWPGFGGMVSFRHPDAVAAVARTKIFSLAESLGGVESLIEVPQAMTHQSVEDSDAAVPADLVRLSCGIEAVEDLISDLAQAFALSSSVAAVTRRAGTRTSIALALLLALAAVMALSSASRAEAAKAQCRLDVLGAPQRPNRLAEAPGRRSTTSRSSTRNRITCARASHLFARFLQDFNGVLPNAWSLNVAKARFSNVKGFGFQVAPSLRRRRRRRQSAPLREHDQMPRPSRCSTTTWSAVSASARAPMR